MRRSVLAFIVHFVCLSVCFCLAPVVACGILYRLIPPVSPGVSFLRLARSSRFLFAFFSFPPWGVSFCRLVLSSCYCVSSSCFLTRFVSSPFVIIIVVVVVRVLPLLSPLSFSFSSSVSPRHCVALASSAFPYCVPIDVPYETTRTRCPVNLFARMPTTTIVIRSRWKIELRKTARMDREERKRHVNENPDEADDARARCEKTGRPTGETKRTDEREADARRRERKAMRLGRERRGGDEDGHAMPQLEPGQSTLISDGKRSLGKRRRASERRE